MVFTSIPAAYLDAANWQQQQPNPQLGNSGSNSQQLLPPPPAEPHGSSSTGSIRPGSMVDRARMANLPMPETALKCPRCESTNTKFCYFNNYSLSQPRHFCKTCRRYWTRGGALRNVPVGGGCRRNKRSKGSSSSKSPASSDRQTGSVSSTNSASSNGGYATADIVGLAPQMPPLRFMSPLHQLTDFAGGDMGLNHGLNYSAISGPMGGVGHLSFNGAAGCGSILSAAGLDQWRVPQQAQQFPFLAGLEGSSHGLYPFEASAEVITGYGAGLEGSSHGLYPFEASAEVITGYGAGGGVNHLRPKVSTFGLITQLASVKMEDSTRELNLSGQFLGTDNPSSDQQYWTTATTSAWTDLSGFTSSSTTSNQI